MLKSLILQKIQEIKRWEGSAGTPGYKIRYKQLKQQLIDLVPDDMQYFEVEGYIVEINTNPVLDKKVASIYTTDSFKKRNQYLQKKYSVDN